jgi:hypothetical protein
MVHVDDNSTLQKMVFVSRCPWCASLLVLVCLFACPINTAEASEADSPVRITGRPAVLADHSAAKTLEIVLPAGFPLHQPTLFRSEKSSRGPARHWEHGEASSQAGGRAYWVPGRVCAETMHRSTRLTGIRLHRANLFQRPAPVNERNPFDTGDGFPLVACFL